MAEHTRRTVLRGTAGLAAAGALTGLGTGGPAAALCAEQREVTRQREMTEQQEVTERHYPFLEGAFTPVTEELTAFDLPVTGRIPRELNGRFLRNGPNVLGLEDPRAHHWMLGDGMVHGVRLRDGKAEWYRNRWVRASQVTKKLGEPYPGPVPGPVPPDDFPCNTHVIPYRGRILALQESGPLPYELDGELRTVGTYDFKGTLEGAFTAHTKFDAHAGELHALAYYPAWDHVRHMVVDPSGRVTRTTRIPMPDAPMVHDFALTEKHVVVIDIPVTFDPGAFERGAPVPYVWNRAHPARVGVMPRAGGTPSGGGPVRWFGIDPVFYSHTLNAYDEGDHVVVDVTTYPAPFDVAGRGSDGPYATDTAKLERWTVDLRHGRVRQRVLDDRPQEFPRVNESFVSRRHRYGYTAVVAEMTAAYLTPDGGTPPDNAFSNALVKHDLSRGTLVHRLPRGAAAGEAVFVPRDGADRRAAEDDGYAIAYVHNPDRGAADLLILAAQDFTGEPVARAHLPGRVPLGFHGSWIADA